MFCCLLAFKHCQMGLCRARVTSGDSHCLIECRCGCLTLFCAACAACCCAQAGVLPYGEAVVSLANTLVALCLNTSGLELVQKTRIMDSFIPIFTNKK